MEGKPGMTRLRYYFDTEFIEDGRTIDLISIGIVCEDDRELYLCNQEAELDRSGDWVRAHVLPQLPLYGHPAWRSRKQMAEDIRQFVSPSAEHKPEFWAYYADYDWVALCQLYGTMMDLPKHFPRFCMDLKQLARTVGNPDLPKQKSGEHNALEDARWVRKTHRYLIVLEQQGQMLAESPRAGR